ncbi:ABC transporter permease [Herminiimonas contaminans]|uniref:Transport permease protein n=1 Tax=Herminiimonas contaminans TaxID=1111140 RepID=A0ABS0ERI9_9BURK|nr:ABC transporter permease [Herminiimonas contaminans]MBF8176669.1 ABC transporter permease [Herminiimonas contaminans]
MNQSSTEKHHLILTPGATQKKYWRDLWTFRELFLILAWRDISVRYKQTVIGALWAVLRPLLTMIVFTIVFSRVAGLPSSGDAPYALMVLAGMLPWMLFSASLGDTSNSLISNANLISKVYFPRMIIPAATIIVSVVDFLVSFFVLLLMMLYYQYWSGWQILWLPAFVLLAVLASLGPGLLAASLNVKYRDFRFIVPFIVQFGIYISPVGFSSTVVPEKWRLLYSINPMVGVIDGFRWCILGGDSPIYWPGFVVSLAVVMLFLYLGVRTFRKTERKFADII